jgi:hypothetical protein
MDLKETGFEGLDQSQAGVGMVIKLWFPYGVMRFLSGLWVLY